MQLVLEGIRADDQRLLAELEPGEVVTHTVVVRVDGAPREFTVFVKANVLPNVDASVVYGDELIEELLRFEPAALNTLYSLVGKYRRGVQPTLPMPLLDGSAAVAEPRLG